MRAEQLVARGDGHGYVEHRLEILPDVELAVLSADEDCNLAFALQIGLRLFQAGQAGSILLRRRFDDRRFGDGLGGLGGLFSSLFRRLGFVGLDGFDLGRVNNFRRLYLDGLRLDLFRFDLFRLGFDLGFRLLGGLGLDDLVLGVRADRGRLDLTSPVTISAGLASTVLSSDVVTSAAFGAGSGFASSTFDSSGFASSVFDTSALTVVEAAAGDAPVIVTAALAGSAPLASAVSTRAWPTVERSSSFASAVSVGLPTSRVASAPLSDFTPSGASTCGASSATGCGATFCVISRGCENGAGLISPGVTSTRAPILVQFHILTANAAGMRMQPCEAG